MTDDLLQALQALADAIPEEAWEAHRERVEFEPDTGIYDTATLHTPDGEFLAGEVYVWSTTNGHHLVDIRQRNVPPGVDLEECSLEIRNGDGIVLLAGDVADEPNETLGESYCLTLDSA